MIWILALALTIVAAAGVYLATSRDLLRVTLGLSFLGSAMVLLVVGSGRVDSAQPPFASEGMQALEPAANPLPQALALTAIVIGFALLCLTIVLVLRAMTGHGVEDAHDLRSVESPSEEASRGEPRAPGDETR